MDWFSHGGVAIYYVGWWFTLEYKLQSGIYVTIVQYMFHCFCFKLSLQWTGFPWGCSYLLCGPLYFQRSEYEP